MFFPNIKYTNNCDILVFKQLLLYHNTLAKILYVPALRVFWYLCHNLVMIFLGNILNLISIY